MVGQARDGVEAVKAASELSPDVIVMDVMMPKKDGVEACREIMESLPETRVIMLTASTEANAVIEAVAAGATGYLQKVVGMDQVLGMMKGAAAGEGRLPTEEVSIHRYQGVPDEQAARTVRVSDLKATKNSYRYRKLRRLPLEGQVACTFTSHSCLVRKHMIVSVRYLRMLT